MFISPDFFREGNAAKVWRTSLLMVFILVISACSTLKPPPPTLSTTAKTPTVALVLGGGGAKGFAHVGVIKALEANGITPTLVVGTSVGSLVGSLYASGMTPMALERLALTTPDSALTDFTLSNQGFVEGIKLKNFINTHVGEQSIEDFPIRFAAIAAEKNTLKKTVFTTGNAGLMVQASCSVPTVFIAPRIPEKFGKKYIDGGVVSLVPVDSARDLGADIIIAVDVTEPSKIKNNTTLPRLNSLSSFWGLLETTLSPSVTGSNTTQGPMMRDERQRADIIIIPDVGHISSLDTSQRRALIDAGTQATTTKMSAIKQLIADYSKSQ